MYINTAKQKMLQGKPAIGAGAVLGSHLGVELLSQAGFDWILVDCQHGNWEDETALLAFRAIRSGSAVPMARVRHNEFAAIGRLLDQGALGIVVPLVNSASEAHAAANAVRYPPRGGRSMGAFLASYHGADYGEWADDQIFLAVQIESAQAVDRAEEILAVEGVDGCWIGPKDLARSMGVDIRTPDGRQAHESAILRVLAACRQTHKIPGIDGDGEVEARRWLNHGFQFVTTTGDAGLLINGGQAILERLRRSDGSAQRS
jgi:4-hydroxy-2-oxoheptanedioate aldolase